MAENEIADPGADAKHAYAIITERGALEKTQRSGRTHAEAMRLAEELRRWAMILGSS